MRVVIMTPIYATLLYQISTRCKVSQIVRNGTTLNSKYSILLPARPASPSSNAHSQLCKTDHGAIVYYCLANLVYFASFLLLVVLPRTFGNHVLLCVSLIVFGNCLHAGCATQFQYLSFVMLVSTTSIFTNHVHHCFGHPAHWQYLHCQLHHPGHFLITWIPCCASQPIQQSDKLQVQLATHLPISCLTAWSIQPMSQYRSFLIQHHIKLLDSLMEWSQYPSATSILGCISTSTIYNLMKAIYFICVTSNVNTYQAGFSSQNIIYI